MRSVTGHPFFALLLAVVAVPCFAARSATLEELFHQGTQAYAAGGFEQAVSLFQDAAKISLASGTLHNLGNAEWQCGRTGPAILA
jgi:hypothetical protein